MTHEVIEIKWKRGSRHKVTAKVAYKEIEKLRKRLPGHGVTAEDIVKHATPKNNALHPEFTWDDAEAAHEHRKNEARAMLRSLEVVYAEAADIGPTKLYEVVTAPVVEGEPKRKVYRSTADILEDPIARDELLSNAIRDALAFRRRYRMLSELQTVFQTIDDFVLKNAEVS